MRRRHLLPGFANCQVLSTMTVSVPITCSRQQPFAAEFSHATATGERMAEHQLQVVALPLTNGWLLS